MRNQVQKQERETFTPAVDIEESDDAITLWADMPGVDEKDLHITLEKNVLTIEAQVALADRRAFTPVHREYGEGDFRRVFTVSDAISHDEVNAVLRDGVLQLELPKADRTKPKTIPVKAG